ncbi:MAG: MFS transporter [Patescibacteria group bacterium]|nr:MFS transporter [Patescibacteria group bacterium]
MLKLLEKLQKTFPAFKYRNYRLYFTGQLISYTGSWLHGVAYGWLVYQLTHSAFWLGAISALSASPVLFFSLFGGFLVDKLNRKKILICTQTSSLILAATLGILVITHTITLPILMLITLLSGITDSLDGPASQAFLIDIIQKDDLHSAIGLNSAIFNTGRVVGPAAAGFLIALAGMGNIFLINALSFLAILISLCLIEVNPLINRKKDKPLKAIKEGIAYASSHPSISLLLLTAGMGAILCFSQATMMPVLVAKVFSGNAQTLGFLLSSTGVGALVGSLIISSRYKKAKAKKFIMIGSALFMAATFAFSFAANIYLASILLFFAGLGLTIQFSSVYTTIQKLVHEDFRGRVSSIYSLMFIGLSPIGNILIGSISSVFGPQMAIRVFTVLIFLYGIGAYYLHKYRLQKHAESLQPTVALAEQ